MGYTPHVAVVGGGTTGVGVARDLAMRGLEVTVVERGPLTAGATGGMHALLHSGARYALTDPESATDCLAENRRLREIAGHWVEDTGGLFVQTAADPDEHFERRREACESVGILTTELTGAEAREREPALSEDVERAFTVPDAGIEPFQLTAATARSASDHGATLLTNTAVVDLERDRETVDEVLVRRTDGTISPGDPVALDADYVVNATGAWAGEVAAMADLEVTVRGSRGAMVVTEDRHAEAVLNRARPRGEGDILVPHGSSSILGTTDIEVSDPDEFPRAATEVDQLFEELAPVVPDLAGATPQRAYWGVRPLYDPGEAAGETTDLTRDFVLLDHEARDDVWGMTTVVGGKLTTHRLMAERVADHVCEKFGIDRRCRTAEVALPGAEGGDPEVLASSGADPETVAAAEGRHGGQAGDYLPEEGPAAVVCPCKRVTAAEVRAVGEEEPVDPTDLDAVRRRTAAGAGRCQGGCCAHRLAATLHPERTAETVAASLDEFLTDRWTGVRPVLWGRRLERAADTYRRHRATMHRGRAPAADLEVFDPGPDPSAAGEEQGGEQ